MGNPKVSVLLPVYNGEKYLHEAIESILHQSYKDFEFIIINDGSTDNSENIIKEFYDPRIRYIKQVNHGLAATLNNAIEISEGLYIARQDQDDYSHPERIRKQIEFLESHLNCVVVGTWAKDIDITFNRKMLERRYGYKRPPIEDYAIKYHLLFDSPFIHSSVMMRKTIFNKNFMYSTDNDRQPPEDYELWSRIGRFYEMRNIPEILHNYRRGPNSMTRNVNSHYLDNATKISIENLIYYLSKDCCDQNISDLAALMNSNFDKISVKPCFKSILELLNELALILSGGIFSQYEFLKAQAYRYFISIKRNYSINQNGKLFGRIKFAFDCVKGANK